MFNLERNACTRQDSEPASAMPLASLLPLGIITAAIGVAGTLLTVIPYATRGERKRMINDRWIEAMYDRDKLVLKQFKS